MNISVGTKNPAKLSAVKEAFQGYDVKITPNSVESGVSNQPMSDSETIQGAINRAEAALLLSGSDIGIGLEGGVQEIGDSLYLCNWGALVQRGERPLIAGGARVPLPKEIALRLMAGEELGPVMDDYTGKRNIRSNEGAIGVFTNNRINRTGMFIHIMELLIGQYQYRITNGKLEQ
ncbi:DUF84 family protein [Bacillus massilinigeriensis]|uniref:DUF84 family protein n=1 Tax=Bacillus mediterraneensis TaxID=1805474 RepID=UPI0008F90C33|nr:DUF84 family protein [Bacillus mediterraneensis]